MAALAKMIFESVVFEGKKTSMHLLCKEGKVDTLRLLTDLKVDLEMKDDEGQTPLMVACRYQKTECCALLLECGAKPNVKDAQGQTPLLLACKQLNDDSVRLLLEHDADPNISVEETGDTPLHIMCMSGFGDKIVRLLLEKGGDPNALNKNKLTPMRKMWRRFYPCHETINSVRLLLEHGADIEQIGTWCETALRMACRKKCPSLIRLFLNHGASDAREALALVTERLQRASSYDKRGVAQWKECKKVLTEHLASMPKKRSRVMDEDDEEDEDEEEEPSAKRTRLSSDEEDTEESE